MKLKSEISGDRINSTFRTNTIINTTSALINKNINNNSTHNYIISKVNQSLFSTVSPISTNQKRKLKSHDHIAHNKSDSINRNYYIKKKLIPKIK